MKETLSDFGMRECGGDEAEATPAAEEEARKARGAHDGADGDLRIMEHFVRVFIKQAEEDPGRT